MSLWVRARWADDEAEENPPAVRPVENAGYAGWVTGHGMEEEGDQPHHHNDDLMDHLMGHDGLDLRSMSKKGRVSLDGPVYATQSHVTEDGLAKYSQGAAHPKPENMPRFVRHQGNLYVDDGHHRVGAALMRGDPHIEGYYYNADKHGFPRAQEGF